MIAEKLKKKLIFRDKNYNKHIENHNNNEDDDDDDDDDEKPTVTTHQKMMKNNRMKTLQVSYRHHRKDYEMTKKMEKDGLKTDGAETEEDGKEKVGKLMCHVLWRGEWVVWWDDEV